MCYSNGTENSISKRKSLKIRTSARRYTLARRGCNRRHRCCTVRSSAIALASLNQRADGKSIWGWKILSLHSHTITVNNPNGSHNHSLIDFDSSYPMLPPTVRFLTKIFHPNVSRHGDVGIDIIQHNWLLSLTISKILLSVQSLLTDPFTEVISVQINSPFHHFKSIVLVDSRYAWNQSWEKCTKMRDQSSKH